MDIYLCSSSIKACFVKVTMISGGWCLRLGAGRLMRPEGFLIGFNWFGKTVISVKASEANTVKC